jgi:hypothetical protein
MLRVGAPLANLDTSLRGNEPVRQLVCRHVSQNKTTSCRFVLDAFLFNKRFSSGKAPVFSGRRSSIHIFGWHLRVLPFDCIHGLSKPFDQQLLTTL